MEAQATYEFLENFLEEEVPPLFEEDHKQDHCRVCYRAGYRDGLLYVQDWLYEGFDIDA